jgi:hypothetical protein
VFAKMPLTLDLPKDIRSRQKRRGPRMNCRVPVSIEWDGNVGPRRFESAFTRVVNGYGCLLVSPREVNLQQVLWLTNLSTRKALEGKVVWKGNQRPDGWDLGVEFLATDLNFWGLDL